jgi:PAS domain S-box-containing protein
MDRPEIRRPSRILLVEDNPGDARLVKEMISEMMDGAFEVETAERLSSACEWLKQGTTDVVLLDLILPDSERLDTLRAVQKCAPTAPIVVLSVIEDEETAMEAVGLGAQEYLVKGHMNSTMLYRAMKYAIRRKELELALRESEERFRLAAENYPAIFAIYDPERRIEFINDCGAKLIGRPREEIIGRKEEDFLPPEVIERYRPALEQSIQNKAPQSTEFSYRTSSGEITYIITFAPVYHDSGHLRHVAAFTHDITERKRVEKALRASETRYRHLSENLEDTVQKKVEQLRKIEFLAQIGQMVSVVAHEIRNPLQNIRMGMDSLRMVKGDAKQTEEVLAEIDHGVNLLNNTVSELLEYSKPVELRKMPWPVDELCRQAVRGLAHLLGKASVSIDCEPIEEHVVVDGPKIIRVLMNLITNSVEAMPEGARISLSSQSYEEAGEKKLRLTVRDSGPGIPPEQLQLIQEPFFTTKLHGTGLGLAICRKLIEAHGGRLTISSKVNEGTSVEMVLPM